MDNKKPLIIVPPMSEPLTKLKEVLDGIASEENIEIFTVNDAKEFTQLVGSGGQALIMLSNAKMCATLLQENRALIQKNHSKVILLTPKEIPIKTLEKFRKIGLTESILENTAPKTLLYKVKLQLKSIKLVQKEDTSQQVVKSMLDLNAKTKLADEEVLTSEKAVYEQLDSSDPEETTRRSVAVDDGEKLDYLSNLKGKNKYQEESIDTHWKSKKDRVETTEESDTEDNMKMKSTSEEDSDIDMFYRGKMKKNETLEVEEEDIYQREKKITEEAPEEEKKKRNSILEEEVIEEKRKKSKAQEIEEENKDYKLSKVEDEEEIEAKKKNALLEEEEESKTKDLISKVDEVVSEEEKDLDLEKGEDLGGYYKGKLKKNEMVEEEIPELTEEKLIAEAEKLEKRKKDKFLEEEELESRKKDKLLEDENNDDDPHEGEVDKIDNYMRGNLESTEAIATRMESNTESKKPLASAEGDDDTDSNKDEDVVETELDLDRKLALAKEEENNKDLKKEKLALDEDNKDYKNEKLALAEEEKDLKSADKNLQLQEEDEDYSERNTAELDIDDESNRKALAKKKEEKDLNRRDIDNSKLDIENNKEKDIHEGKTDKISTYYKSGESKEKEHDWDIGDKKKNTQLDITKTKKQEISIESTKKAHGPEETIDYRKLKEEFDMISRGESTSDGSIEGAADGGLQKNYNSEEAFKVVELGPVSFDFSIEILNLIYTPDMKPALIFKTVAEKLLQDEKAYMVSYTYKLSDKKFTENFNSYNEFPTNVTEEIKSTWESIKNDPINAELFVNISMPTWMCRSIPEKDTFWRDLDLPQWASKELTDKPVELVYPFFDGVDRMGYVHILFPTGINPTNEKKINIVIEMLRSVFLDTVQRKSPSKSNDSRDEDVEEQSNDNKKGNVLNFFGNIFGKKKAG